MKCIDIVKLKTLIVMFKLSKITLTNNIQKLFKFIKTKIRTDRK